MLAKPRPRLTYANVVSTLCLFIVLGGSAYAAATIGSADIKDGAVLSRHIKDREVKNVDLSKNAVGGSKVIDNSLTGADIAEGTLGKVPNAAKLGGIAASGFQRAGFLYYGTGTQQAGGEDTIIRRDDFATITTNDDQEANTIRILNNASNAAINISSLAPALRTGIGGGDTTGTTLPVSTLVHFMISKHEANALKTWVVTCMREVGSGQPPIVCQAVAEGAG